MPLAAIERGNAVDRIVALEDVADHLIEMVGTTSG
jgi:hypothetical protein